MQKELEQSIIKTLAYFDIADYPLTKEELFRYLWQPPRLSYEDFEIGLAEVNVHWREKHGYYFLVGRDEIVDSRRARALESARKLQRAKRAAGFISAIPFLQAIFVCNSVGREAASEDSDIDFFIITEAHRIWIVRFFSNFILRLFGLRTYGKKRQDRICLSFFVDIEHLNLLPYRMVENDIHYIYWLEQMVPLYDPRNLYNKFLQSNNWTVQFVPYRPRMTTTVSSLMTHNTSVGKFWKTMWEKMWVGTYGDAVESQAKQAQLQKMKIFNKDKELAENKGVVIIDGVIKLHENDTRLDYLKKWKEKVSQLC